MTDGSIYGCRFDHLVVTAASVREGVDWMAAKSGVKLPEGGSHPLMGTHNHLSALAANQFLEIIAIDPTAPAPEIDRWFALDDDQHQDQLRQSPRLTTWVVATDNLDLTLAATRELGLDVGQPVTLTRDELTWRLALKPDGSLAFDGVFPVFIQWPNGVNPVELMQDQGLRLDGLTLFHPDHHHLQQAFDHLGLSNLATLEQGPTKLHATMRAGNFPFELT